MRLILGALLVLAGCSSQPSTDPATPDQASAKPSYVQKANEEVRDWSSKIKSLEDRSQAKGAEARGEVDRHLQSVKKNYQEARDSLKELEVSMAKLKAEYEKAMTAFKKTEKQVVSKKESP